MAGTTNTKQKDDKGYESYTEKGREMASSAASTVGQKAADAASSVSEKAGEVASRVGQKAEDATAAVGGSMKSLAGAIRENAPRSGMMGNVSSSVASTLESGGRYLEEQGLSGIGKDMTEMIRRNPLAALLIGVGLGFLLARATQRS